MWKKCIGGGHSRGGKTYKRMMDQDKIEGENYVERMEEGNKEGVKMVKIKNAEIGWTMEETRKEAEAIERRAKEMPKLTTIKKGEKEEGNNMDQREDQGLDVGLGELEEELTQRRGLTPIDLNDSVYRSGQDTDNEENGEVQVAATDIGSENESEETIFSSGAVQELQDKVRKLRDEYGMEEEEMKHRMETDEQFGERVRRWEEMRKMEKRLERMINPTSEMGEEEGMMADMMEGVEALKWRKMMRRWTWTSRNRQMRSGRN